LLCVRFTDVLFARLEEQWFDKLNGHTIHPAIEVIDPTDSTHAIEQYRIERAVRVKIRDAKVGCEQLVHMGTVRVGVEKQRHTSAANIDQLAR
jgi:hypothetical protein